VDDNNLRAGFTPSGHGSPSAIGREDDVVHFGSTLEEGKQRHLQAAELGARAPMMNLGRDGGRHVIDF